MLKNHRLQSIYKSSQALLPLVFFWFASIVGNICSWAHNLIASHNLNLPQFANFTIYQTFQYLFSIFTVSYMIAVNRFGSAYFKSKSSKTISPVYFSLFFSIVLGLVSSGLYLLTISWWTKYLHFSAITWFFPLSTLLFLISVPLSWTRGIFNAQEQYVTSGVSHLLESFSKIILAGLATLIFYKFAFISLALPFSMLIAFVIALFQLKKPLQILFAKPIKLSISKSFLHFYLQAIVLQIGALTLINIDVLLVKHYFSPQQAGVYALLSLVGKTILFGSQSFAYLLIPIVSSKIEKGEATQKAFFLILLITTGSAALASALFYFLPNLVLRLLLGSHYQLVLPYLGAYQLAMIGLTIALTFSVYHLLKKRFLYTLLVVIALVFETVLIILRHQTLTQVVGNVLLAAGTLCLFMIIMHMHKFITMLKNGYGQNN
ncbi:hypothetical protein GYA49_01575 [Candidatus Beckwithbacteria bacterium]|nr:hypothetical protein [Candidatus Beckwithbacteria bacterium]